MSLDAGPGFDLGPPSGVERPLHPYGKYEHIPPAKPFDFLSRKDIDDMMSQDEKGQNGPRLIEHYGQNGEMEVLSPYTHVYLQTLREIRQMDAFRNIVGNTETNRDVTGTGPLTVQERIVAKKVLEFLGKKEYLQKRGLFPASLVEDAAREDKSSARLAEDLANHMWLSQEAGTEKPGQRDEFVKNLVSYRYKELGSKSAIYDHDLPEKNVLPPHQLTESSKLLSPSASPEEARIAIESQPGLSQSITEYNTAKLARDPLKDAREKQSREYVKNYIIDRLPKAENVDMTNFPTVVILHGVGQTQEMWQQRIDYYKSHNINVKYIQVDEFPSGTNFEEQADIIYDRLQKEGLLKNLIAPEAHSLGALIATHLMYKHPEIISHAIITGAPTRSDKDLWPSPLVSWLKWGLANPELALKVVKYAPGMGFFRQLGREGLPHAFQVYLAHIGDKDRSQWEQPIRNTSWTIPKLLVYGAKDSMVKRLAGMSAAKYATGAIFVENPIGGHNAIGWDEDALEIHKRLYNQSLVRQKAIIGQKVEEMAVAG